jgi:hypothetical protein
MPNTGTETPVAIFIQTTAGVATNYANKTAFTGAGWDISWRDADDNALASQPTWDISAGSGGRHVINFVMPAGVWTARITVPAGSLITPIEFWGEGLTYDPDDIYGALVASVGTPVTATALATASTIYDGDSIAILMTVPEGALTALGAANLAACTLAAQGKRRSLNSDDAADVTTFTETIVTDTAGARVIRVTLAAFPSAWAVPDDTESVAVRIDLRLTYSGQTLTAAVHDLTISWKAST